MDQADSDGWNWAWLYYAGVVLLRLSEETFWKCTPRKLNELLEIHMEFKGGKSEKEETRTTGFIDEVF